MICFRRFITFLFLFSSIYIFGNGEKDTLIKSKNAINYFTSDNFQNSDSLYTLNTSLFSFQNYYNRYAIGNNGLPINSFVFHQMESRDLDFNYSSNSYSAYFNTPQKNKYYKVSSPYSDILYVIGSKREQLFKMVFSYNFNSRTNFTFNFSRLRADGFYNRQNLIHNYFSSSSYYSTKNNRYSLLFSAIYNGVNVAENGGIVDDSAFLYSKSILDRKLFDVNLDLARNRIKNKNFRVTQFFSFGKPTYINDSIKSINAKSRISLITEFEDKLVEFTDDVASSDFYNSIYYDTLKTYDSTYYYRISNKLEWKRLKSNKESSISDLFGVALNLSHEYIGVKQRLLDSMFSSIVAGVRLYNMVSKNRLWYTIDAKYGIAGYNENGYSLSASLKKKLNDSNSYVHLYSELKEQSADFINSMYYSNHFKWNNNFDKIQSKKIGLKIYINKYSTLFGIDYSQNKNFIYFDNYAISRQYNSIIPILSVFVNNKLSFYNWHLATNVVYQNVPDSMVIRLPTFVIKNSLYYENYLFKKALLMQVGIDCFYNSEFYSNRYMPATSQFYLQDNNKYGNYLLMDFFIAAKIKDVKLFTKIEHLNDRLMSVNYIQTPNYPIAGRAFKFGVSWSFYD
jgi:hypothetical protein